MLRGRVTEAQYERLYVIFVHSSHRYKALPPNARLRKAFRAALDSIEAETWACFLPTENDTRPKIPLTSGQMALVSQYALGGKTKKIAHELGISNDSARGQLHKVYKKVGVKKGKDLRDLMKSNAIYLFDPDNE